MKWVVLVAVLLLANSACAARVSSPTPTEASTPTPRVLVDEVLDCQAYTESAFGILDDLTNESLAGNQLMRSIYVRQHDADATEDDMEELAMEVFTGLESTWRRMLDLLDSLDALPAPSPELTLVADALTSTWREPLAAMLQFSVDLKSGVNPDVAVTAIEGYDNVQYELLPLYDEFDDLLLECEEDAGPN